MVVFSIFLVWLHHFQVSKLCTNTCDWKWTGTTHQLRHSPFSWQACRSFCTSPGRPKKYILKVHKLTASSFKNLLARDHNLFLLRCIINENIVHVPLGRGNLQGDAADRLWLRPGIVMAIYYNWQKNNQSQSSIRQISFNPGGVLFVPVCD